MVVTCNGGSGSDHTISAHYWLWPLPPDGALTFFAEWPALYHCFASSTVGWFASTYDDLVSCLERANNAVGEQPSDPISNVHDVVGDEGTP